MMIMADQAVDPDAEQTRGELGEALIMYITSIALSAFKEAVRTGVVNADDLNVMPNIVDVNFLAFELDSYNYSTSAEVQKKLNQCTRELMTNETFLRMISETVQRVARRVRPGSDDFCDTIEAQVATAAQKFVAKVVATVFTDVDPIYQAAESARARAGTGIERCLNNNNANDCDMNDNNNVNSDDDDEVDEMLLHADEPRSLHNILEPVFGAASDSDENGEILLHADEPRSLSYTPDEEPDTEAAGGYIQAGDNGPAAIMQDLPPRPRATRGVEGSSKPDLSRVRIRPMFGDQSLDIDQELIGRALGVISVKHDDDLYNPSGGPTKRNSFRDLRAPDVSHLPRFTNLSDEHTASTKMEACARRILDRPTSSAIGHSPGTIGLTGPGAAKQGRKSSPAADGRSITGSSRSITSPSAAKKMANLASATKDGVKKASGKSDLPTVSSAGTESTSSGRRSTVHKVRLPFEVAEVKKMIPSPDGRSNVAPRKTK